MAVVSDKKMIYEKRLKELTSKLEVRVVTYVLFIYLMTNTAHFY